MALDMEKYKQVRMAQAQGARTIDELKKVSDIVIENESEVKEIEALLQNACRCMGVSVQDVVNAVNNGASTVEAVGEATGAGTACGRCKSIIANIIENKR